MDGQTGLDRRTFFKGAGIVGASLAVPSLLAARDECMQAVDAGGAPVAIIAATVKGRGLSFLQDTVDSHYQPMTDAQYEQALGEITRAHEALLHGYHHAD